MSTNKKPKSVLESYREVGPYLGLGTQLAASIVLMFFLGRWLDQKFETEPALTIIFSFIGGFGGVYNFIRAVLNINEKNKREKKS